MSQHQQEKFYTMTRRAKYAVNWDDVSTAISTGDVALFSGQSVVSEFIKNGQGGTDWSHIGMFVRSEEDDRVLLWESTTYDGLREVMTGKRRGGVRLVDAKECIQHYMVSDDTAKVILRQVWVDEFVKARGVVDPEARSADLWAFMRRVSGMPYERNFYELGRAMYGGLGMFWGGRTKKSYFCSELVAESYMVLGLLPYAKLDDNHNEIQRMIIERQRKDPHDGKPFHLPRAIWAEGRNPSMYTPLDFSQEAQNLPFLYNRHTNRSMVDLGPHFDIVFTTPDPLKCPPKGMDRPIRTRVRVPSLAAPPTGRERLLLE